MTRVKRAAETALHTNKAGSGTDVWLARIFLIAILVAGFTSLLFGASPENLALCPCLFHSITGLECPGCGMTRACISLASGEVVKALNYNPFSLGLVFFAGGFALAPKHIRRYWQWLPRNSRTAITGFFLILVLGFWSYRIFL